MIHNPKNIQPYEKLWAVLSVDESGNEGVLAVGLDAIGITPLITGSKKVLKHFEKIAIEQVKHAPDKRIVVGEFERTKTRAVQNENI